MHDRARQHAVRLRPAARKRLASRTGTSPLAVLGMTAAGLAAAALFNGARARAAVMSNPPRGSFVDVGDAVVHYVEHGSRDKPPIVLIHGNGSMTDDFELSGIVGPLAAKHRVILFDRPGCGYSTRPGSEPWTAQRQAAVLVAAAAQLGIERPVVVGHSWGTLVALAWAIDHPGAIGALVLASGYYYPTTRVDIVANKPSTLPVIGAVMRHTTGPIIGRLTSSPTTKFIFSPAEPTPAFVAGFPFEMALRPSQLRATNEDTAQMAAAAASLEPGYKTLKLPMVLIAGDGDKLVDYSWHTKQLAGAFPHARLNIVAGAGHMVHHIDPAAFVAAVEQASAMLA